MTPLAALLTIYAALSSLYWLIMGLSALLTVRRLPLLSKLNPPEPQLWPRLSVVIPACNEAEELEGALTTLLDEDYPNLELVLVNDRSSDSTRQTIERIAAGDRRVKALHITKLPEGWLGKVNALNRGFHHSTGEFLLFTDADVHFNKGTLRKAVAYCLQENLDHLTALPAIWPASFLLSLLIAVFMRQLAAAARPWKVNDPRSRAFLGVGAFNLVRRSAFQATQGFEWLRMELADDVGLGLMMKRAGARCRVVNAFSGVGLRFYSSFAGAVKGSEKGYALCHYRLWRSIVGGVVLLLLEMSPILTPLPLAYLPLAWIGYCGIAVSAAFVFSALALDQLAAGMLVPALLGPLIAPLIAGLFIRAGIVGSLRGGIIWRGTLYRSEALRQGTRLPLP